VGVLAVAQGLRLLKGQAQAGREAPEGLEVGNGGLELEVRAIAASYDAVRWKTLRASLRRSSASAAGSPAIAARTPA